MLIILSLSLHHKSRDSQPFLFELQVKQTTLHHNNKAKMEGHSCLAVVFCMKLMIGGSYHLTRQPFGPKMCQRLSENAIGCKSYSFLTYTLTCSLHYRPCAELGNQRDEACVDITRKVCVYSYTSNKSRIFLDIFLKFLLVFCSDSKF